MSDDRPKHETITIEESTEVVSLLDRKSLCTKQDLYGIIAEFRQKSPWTRFPYTAFLSSSVLSETKKEIMDDMLALLNESSLDPYRALDLLEHVGRLLEMDAGLPRKTIRSTLLEYTL